MSRRPQITVSNHPDTPDGPSPRVLTQILVRHTAALEASLERKRQQQAEQPATVQEAA